MMLVGINVMLNGEECEKRIRYDWFLITKNSKDELTLTLKETINKDQSIYENRNQISTYYDSEKKYELLVDHNSENYILNIDYSEIFEISRQLFENPVIEIYVSSQNRCFYSLEDNWDTKTIFLNKRTFYGELIESKVLNISLDSFKSIAYARGIIVNESSDLLIISTNYEDVFIYSLKKNQLIFQDKGRMLLTITQETDCLYYSNMNELFFVDYNTSMNRNIVKTFVDKKERIIDFIKVYDDYVLVTSKKAFSLWNLLFAELILGSYEYDHSFYQCDIEGDILKKKSLLLKKREGWSGVVI